jgi:pimeloyl-ACP methyl ester carboxylesterase
MKIKRASSFRQPATDLAWFEQWVKSLERLNGHNYERMHIRTALGTTQVWGLNTSSADAETLVIFPGARTSVLFWDLGNGLKELAKYHRIFLVETNGLPNGSDGKTPDIRSAGYGEWASEVLEKLDIAAAHVAGASFGGLICMKLAIVAPEKVKKVFLLNPGCLQPFSLSVKNLWYNLLPILFPKRKNVVKFLDKAVFSKPDHQLPEAFENLLIDYELFALTRFRDKTQKPYYMNEELKNVSVPVYLLLGDRDLLFPVQRSIENARKHLPDLREVHVLKNIGHGIETHKAAMDYLLRTIEAQIPAGHTGSAKSVSHE